MKPLAWYCLWAGLAWACGGDVGGPRASSNGGSGSGQTNVTIRVNLPFDPTQGCRDTSTPDCAQCCSASTDTTGTEMCTVVREGSSSSVLGPCPSDCPHCAACSTATERFLASAVAQSRPDCDCRSQVIGIDPCIAPNDCGCFCDGLDRSLSQCPQLAPAVCQTANHCGVELMIAPGPYHQGDAIDVYWLNFTLGPANVNNCGNLDVEQYQVPTTTIPPAYVRLSSAKPCASPTDAMTLAPGAQSAPVTITVPSGVGGGHFLFHGTYHIDCNTEAVPATTCNPGAIDVSIGFDVYSQ